jgi:hypothetical protein
LRGLSFGDDWGGGLGLFRFGFLFEAEVQPGEVWFSMLWLVWLGDVYVLLLDMVSRARFRYDFGMFLLLIVKFGMGVLLQIRKMWMQNVR